jgi:hypothetical protein
MIAKHKQVIDEWLLNGEDEVKAYLKVYPNRKLENHNQKDSIRVQVKAILATEEAQEYIKSIKQITTNELILTRQKQLQDLEDLKIDLQKEMKKSHFGINPFVANFVKIVEVQNKMLGFNEPDKIDLTSKGESMNEIKVTFINSRID